MNPPLDKLRLWHVAESYPPSYGGGAALYLRDVCRFLAERGHEVRVLCTEGTCQPPYTLRTEWDGAVQVDRLNLPYFKSHDPGGWLLGRRAWYKHRLQVERLVEDLLTNWTPDLVQFHTPHPVDEEFILAIQRHGLPVVGMSHCAWTICPRLNLLHSPTATACSGPATLKCLACLYSHYDGGRLRAWLKMPWRLLKLGTFPAYRLYRRTRLRRSIQGLISYSEFMAAAHQGHVQGPVRFVPLGVNLANVPTARPARPRSPLRFGFMAGFQPHKGIWDLLAAVADLKQQGWSFEMHLWGPGQEDRQADLIARAIEDHVLLHGVFQPPERWTIFSEIDVLVMATTVAEAYGRVVQEAAAVGVPTIAPAVGGIVEQIRDGVDGLLFRFRDRHDLARQMARVLQEPDLAARLAANLRPVLDTRTAVGAVEQFYYDILEGQQRRLPLATIPPHSPATPGVPSR